jgi:hypothetical protein
MAAKGEAMKQHFYRAPAPRVAGLTLSALFLGLTVSASGAEPPPLSLVDYTIQAVATAGDTVGGVRTNAGSRLEVDGLNDNGQLVLLVDNAAGGSALLQYAEGRFTPIVVGGGDGPGGQWPQDLHIDGPASMNQFGNVVFTADFPAGSHASGGLYRWDRQAQRVTAAGLSGMPAGTAGALLDFRSAVINNRNEIAFVGGVANDVMLEQSGLFVLGPDGKLLSLSPPGQKLPFSEAGDLLEPSHGELSLNDAGVVAFTADFDQLGGTAYAWEQGTVTPLLPDIHRNFFGILLGRAVAWVNNQNRAVLVATSGDPLMGVGIVRGLYRWADGSRTPLLVTGQATSSGGTKQASGGFNISAANEAGQHVVVTTPWKENPAAYRLDADGKLSLIVQSGMATDLGPITDIGRLGNRDSALNRPGLFGFIYDTNLIPGSGGALNRQGQVALTVQINGGPDTVVLLTPKKP